jgi:hypothetical protein
LVPSTAFGFFEMTVEHAVATPWPDAGGNAGEGDANAGAPESIGDTRTVRMTMVRFITWFSLSRTGLAF